MDLAPAGTVDPTPFLYDTTCYLAAALMSVAALSNLVIGPLDLNKELKTMEMGPKTKRPNCACSNRSKKGEPVGQLIT